MTFKAEMQLFMNAMASAYQGGDAHACAQMFVTNSDAPPLLE